MVKNIPAGFRKILDWFSAFLFLLLVLAGPLMMLIIMREVFHVYLYGEEDILCFLFVISITTLVIVLALNKFEHTNFLHFPKLRSKPLMVSILLGVLVWLFGYCYFHIFFPEVHTPTIKTIYGVIFYILTPVLPPITEEMFFRGWLLGYMEKKSFSKTTLH